MSLRRAAPSFLLVLALAAAWPPNVTAEHHGNPGVGSFLNCDPALVPPRCTSVDRNSVHHVFIRGSVPGRLAGAVVRTMREDYGPTNLVMRLQSRVTRKTDVIVRAADYGENGAAGWVWCPPSSRQGINEHGDRWCQRQQLHFNLNGQYAAYFADRGSRDYMACHEMGHTLGLHHWGNPPISPGPERPTCMQPNVPNGPTDLHRWDREDLSMYYPKPPSDTVAASGPALTIIYRLGRCFGPLPAS